MNDPQHLKLDSHDHDRNRLWLSSDGKVYYGPDDKSLVLASAMDDRDTMPPIFITDLVRVFKIGLDMGRVGARVDALCNCGYLLPSNGALDPQVHEETCAYRLTEVPK